MMSINIDRSFKISPKGRSALAWIFVFLFFLFSFWGGNFLFSLLHAIIVTVILILVSIFESKIMVKYFLQKGKDYLFYFINFVLIGLLSWVSVIVEFDMAYFMQHYLPIQIPTPENFSQWILPYIIRLLMLTAVVGISAISALQKTEKENMKIRNELNSEKLDMELRYLKSQINPHFLFNALNNIYSLVYTHDENAPQSILKLSEMLRYVMVDCQADTISLEKEVNYINNYIDFQLMRMESSPDVKFVKDIQNQGFKLPPMILQPLIENSFKHSRLENDSNGFVHFSLKQEGERLEFVAHNSIRSSSLAIVNVNKKKDNGIGMQNVRKRLTLHYGGNYSFETKQDDNSFWAIIKIGK